MKILYNDELTEIPLLTPLSRGFQFGYGFFTTIKVVNGRGENLKYHIDRVKESLTFFNFPLELQELEKSITKVVEANNLYDCRVKVITFRDLDRVSTIYIPGELPEEMESATLGFSGYFRGNNPIHRIKSLNYYSNLEDAFKIIEDSNKNILETGIGNIFIIEEDSIITPPRLLSLLPGTYRNMLVDLKTIGVFKVVEEVITRDRLLKAEEVFFTNALRGIVPVNKIENISYSMDKTITLKRLLSRTN